ncbi:M23 family metallopeptidase [Novosphingobium sp. KCTC 2891]|uniref:M23 family metallopeptidase n=1 Tax=Novosphingobium sp. KCTC 2891 TaxID=2989730 RepID=UPI00222284AD|nr:M23 family metallopeptidase [Novosphingobium sp. KCTC 2891]MCW1383240.1 M23 family metallopeptidase [Novosphingobium sp. KCTC 2891]
MSQNNKTLRNAFGALAALASLFSVPAFANSAASADIATPLRAAEAAKSGVQADTGDQEFRRLFSSWQSLDGGISPAAQSRRSGVVSIPSLMPINSGRALSSGFGMRVHPVLGGLRAHKGIDLPATTGTPIYATADGVVGKADWFGGYGLYVQLEHGASLETRYGHMSRIAVAEGQHVRKGDVIGYVGSTGRSTGAHLHYEVRVAGEAVNPLPYMQGGNRLLAVNDQAEGRGGPEE